MYGVPEEVSTWFQQLKNLPSSQQTSYLSFIVYFRALSLYTSLDKLKSEIVDLKHSVAESLITPAKKSIEELQTDVRRRIKLDNIKIDLPPLPSPPMIQAEEHKTTR